MARCYNFVVIQFPAHPVRNERLNLGIAIFDRDRLDVRATARLEKLRAISAAVDIHTVQNALNQLSRTDQITRNLGSGSPKERLLELSAICPFEFSTMGEFVAPDSESYQRQIDLLLKRLVDPEPAPVGPVAKRSSSLLKSIKSALRSERVLAKRGESLDAHRVVSNHQIAEGLSADLLLKNGAMHIVETVDASSSDGSLKRAISGVAVSALVFEQARMHFGEAHTNTQLVYTASAFFEKSLSPALSAAEHQGARLVNWQSADDQRKFITSLARLAIPLEKGKPRPAVQIDASVQHKFNLN